jgi:23S rRNA pseudouridine2605 synthase
MEFLGFTVNRLIRISYGPFQLRDLKAGEVDEVKQRVLADQMGWSTRSKIRPRNKKERNH